MIHPLAKMTFEATVGLSEAEVRQLHLLCSYDAAFIARLLAERLTPQLNVNVLSELLHRWRDETGQCIRRFDAARRAFDGKKSSPAEGAS